MRTKLRSMNLLFGQMPGLPITFIIGRDGKICGQHPGFGPRNSSSEIKALL